MIRLEIEFDREKIEREDVYDFKKMCDYVEDVFAVDEIPRKAEDTDIMIFTDTGRNTDMGSIFSCIFFLEKQDWFLSNLKKCIYYDDDETIDILKKNNIKLQYE